MLVGICSVLELGLTFLLLDDLHHLNVGIWAFTSFQTDFVHVEKYLVLL